MMTGLEGPALSQGINVAATNIKRPITKYNNINNHIQSVEDELNKFDSVIYDKKRYIEENKDAYIDSAASSPQRDRRVESIRRAEKTIKKDEEDMETEKTKLKKLKNKALTRSGKMAYALTPNSEDKLKGSADHIRRVNKKHAESQARRQRRHTDATVRSTGGKDGAGGEKKPGEVVEARYGLEYAVRYGPPIREDGDCEDQLLGDHQAELDPEIQHAQGIAKANEEIPSRRIQEADKDAPKKKHKGSPSTRTRELDIVEPPSPPPLRIPKPRTHASAPPTKPGIFLREKPHRSKTRDYHDMQNNLDENYQSDDSFHSFQDEIYHSDDSFHLHSPSNKGNTERISRGA